MFDSNGGWDPATYRFYTAVAESDIPDRLGWDDRDRGEFWAACWDLSRLASSGQVRRSGQRAIAIVRRFLPTSDAAKAQAVAEMIAALRGHTHDAEVAEAA